MKNYTSTVYQNFWKLKGGVSFLLRKINMIWISKMYYDNKLRIN